MITKEDVRQEAESLVHPDARGAHLGIASTSGSTGIPLRFHESDHDRAAQHECFCRLYLFLPRDSYRIVSISDLAASDAEDAPWSLLSYSSGGREIRHDMRFLSSRDTADALADRVLGARPQVLEGYASALYLVARVLLARGISLEEVEVVSPAGEQYCDSYDPAVRAAFPRARVCGRYGASELGALAWQCPGCRQYHLNSDWFAFRPLDGDRLALSKRFVSGFQLVDYDLGDRVRFTGYGHCPVDLPTVEVLQGRRDDLLLGPEGETLPIMAFSLGDLEDLAQWQVVQHPDLSLVVHAIADRESEALARELARRVRQALREVPLPLEVRFVRRLEGPAKLKRVVSLRGP